MAGPFELVKQELGELRARLAPGLRGDPARHLSEVALREGLARLPVPRQGRGRVRLLVSRGEEHRRWMPESLELHPETGVEGDAWGRRSRPNPEAMVTVMEHGVAELIGNSQDLGLFGDNVLVDLDLSYSVLPAGARIRLGPVLCELTSKPHRGCGKFAVRFGSEARALLAAEDLADRSLRGRHLRVLEGGRLTVGDAIVVLG